MGKFRTVVSVVLMVLAALAGFAVDAGLSGSGFGGANFVCHDRGLCLRDLCTG